jgi:hypothetical protein
MIDFTMNLIFSSFSINLSVTIITCIKMIKQNNCIIVTLIFNIFLFQACLISELNSARFKIHGN